jgi:hypothetical protein
MRHLPLLALALTLFGVPPTISAQSAEQLEQDARRMEASRERMQEAARYTGPPRGALVDEVMRFKLDDQRAKLALRAELAELREELAERYGDTPQDYREKFADYLENPHFYWQGIEDYLRQYQPEQMQRRGIDECLDAIESELDVAEHRSLRYRIRILEAVPAALRTCMHFHPDPPPLFERRAARIPEQLTPILEEAREEQMELLQERRWPSGVRRVSGGGSVRSLANAAKQHLSRNPEWGGHEERDITIVAVTVAGDWIVAERNILGQPTKYGLPVHAAVIQPETPEGQVDHFELTMVTPNASKGTRFEGARVGDYERMLINRVPGGRRAARRR